MPRAAATETVYQARQRIRKARARRNKIQVTEMEQQTTASDNVVSIEQSRIDAGIADKASLQAEASVKKTNRPTAWKPGQSGNPAGRKPITMEEREFREACKALAPQVLATFTHLMENGEKESTRLAAAQFLAERSFGKAVQPTENKNITVTSSDLTEEEQSQPEDAYKKLAAA